MTHEDLASFIADLEGEVVTDPDLKSACDAVALVQEKHPRQFDMFVELGRGVPDPKVAEQFGVTTAYVRGIHRFITDRAAEYLDRLRGGHL